MTHITMFKNRISVAPLMIAVTLASVYSAFASLLSLPVISIVLFTVYTSMAIVYLRRGIFNRIYSAAAVAALLFILFGFLKGFYDIFPMTGSIVFTGFGISYLLLATIYFPVQTEKKARLIYFIIVAAYILAAYLYYILFPKVYFTFIPTAIVIPVNIVGEIIIKRRFAHNSKLRNSNPRISVGICLATVLFLVVILIVFDLSGTKFINLRSDEKIELSSLIKNVENHSTIDNYLAVGRFYFKHGDINEATHWFNKVIAKDQNEPISRAYLAAIMGIRAEKAILLTEKSDLVNNGMAQIDRLVKENRDIYEIVYIRACFYAALPTMFRKRNVAIEDLKYILTRMSYNEPLFVLASKKLNAIAPEEIANMDNKTKEEVLSCVRNIK